MKALFHKFPANLALCFRGYNLLGHLLAIALTYVIVNSGFDWFYFSHSRSSFLRSIIFPAVIIGGLLPIIAPFIIFLIGKLLKSLKIINSAYALGQAALLGLFVSDFYKAFTGRPGPPGFLTQNFVTDISRDFRFCFFRGGIFFGWPSSHTTIAFAMAVTLWKLYPGSKAIRYIAILYAFYVGIGVSVSIHWFSDFVAGVIIGSVIGAVVGKSFRNYSSHIIASYRED